MSLPLPKNARIVEVGPRDGLQNEARFLPTDRKIELIHRLAAAGLSEIEITSFTHPRWIPALADAEDVVAATGGLGLRRFALVPNRRGLDRALRSDAEGITLVLSASDAHNRANLNRDTDASVAELLELDDEARAAGRATRISVSVVFGCPFSGTVDPRRIEEIVARFAERGPARIGLCDTIGIAHPAQVYALSREMIERFPAVEFELHLHDTYGRALANTLAGLQAGIRSFDAAVGGLGGCPYAPGATGNVATEDLSAMLGAMGVETGLDEARLLQGAAILAEWRDRPLDSAIWRLQNATCTKSSAPEEAAR